MAYETKDMSGSLFKNRKKEKDTHPDYNGSVKINGEELWISGWIKQDKNGNQYMSLAFKPKDTERAQVAGSAPRKAAEMDDEIPFSPEVR